MAETIRGWRTIRWHALALLLLALLLAACGPGATAHPSLSTTPTPRPRPSYLTYIGADGNIWRLNLPEGSAVQLTSDARPHAVTYSGLAWSPDGTQLATVRATSSGPGSAAQLVVLRAGGQIVLQAPLLAVPYSHAFVWSPDSRYIAYRILEARTSSSQALLVVLDTRTGALHKALTYPFQQGCAATATALSASINAIHQTDGGIDTFGWAPDGNTVLASAGCTNDSSLRIDISSGSVATGFPRGATFQPGGTLLLGVWTAGGGALELGLRDDANGFVRDLTQESAPSSVHYAILAGQAVWSASGSQVYYEHADGIWRIGADGSGARAVAPGAPLDSRHAATVELAPAVSPDGRMLVYCELQGADTPAGTITRTWYLAAPDGSNPAVLPDLTTEAVWQPLPVTPA